MSSNREALSRMRLANPALRVDADELDELRSTITDEIATTPSRTGGRRDAESPSGWRLQPALVMAAAAVVIFALFLPISYIGERNDVADGTATPSSLSVAELPASVAPLSVDPRDLQWRRVDMPGLSGAYLWFDGVIAGGPGLIAVGSSNWPDPAFIWTSTDGVEWSPANVETASHSSWAFDVTAGGPGYVAVGSAIWTSVDGVQWREAELEAPIAGELRSVVAWESGLVAVGTFNGIASPVFTSTDGLRWSRIPEEGAPEGQGDSAMLDIAVGSSGLVAVGHLGPVGSAWTSPDGLEWTRAPHDPEVFGTGTEGTELFSVAADDAGFVAVGRVTDDGTMGVWRSVDGATWSVVHLDPGVLNDGHELKTVISTEQGFIAGGDGGEGTAGMWFSPDGITWARLTGEAFAGADTEYISDLAVLADRVIAVGVRFFGDGDSEVVWIGGLVEE